MLEVVLVFCGAGLGGVLRFVMGSLVYFYTGRNFPFGTLMVNLTGSFIMGFLYIVITKHLENFVPELTAFILVGVLGGYTTFSSFSLETLKLFEDGKLGYALCNVCISTVGGIVLAYVGVLCARVFLTH